MLDVLFEKTYVIHERQRANIVDAVLITVVLDTEFVDCAVL